MAETPLERAVLDRHRKATNPHPQYVLKTDLAGGGVGTPGPKGDTGERGATGATGTTLPSTFVAENKEAVTIAKGMAVATHSSGIGIVLALAADGTKPGVGMAVDAIAAAVSGDVQTDGLYRLMDWTAVTGTALLTRGPYYLDPTTPGMLTATAPTTAGQIVLPFGYAVGPDTLEISVGPLYQL